MSSYSKYVFIVVGTGETIFNDFATFNSAGQYANTLAKSHKSEVCYEKLGDLTFAEYKPTLEDKFKAIQEIQANIFQEVLNLRSNLEPNSEELLLLTNNRLLIDKLVKEKKSESIYSYLDYADWYFIEESLQHWLKGTKYH